MKKIARIWSIGMSSLLLLTLTTQLQSQENRQDSVNASQAESLHSLEFRGQVSAWALYNGGLELPANTGGRYIPQLNYEYRFAGSSKLDFEASANLNGMLGFNTDSLYHDGRIKPYRLWARYSGEQFELRAGLQKINFGSANMIRPLMWFDGVDPRDPLNLTDGVWGLLGRYYFLNNANIWLWALYGNKNPRGWDLLGTFEGKPEFGGRFQSPVPRGEAAISYHYRQSEMIDPLSMTIASAAAPEHRLGLDLRMDLVIGLWAEAAWIHNTENLGIYSNQELLNLGMDYTFGLGSGLYVIYEQLLASYDKDAFALENTVTLSLLSLSYPIGLFSNISAIVYYDWSNNEIYNFLNINHQFKHMTLYLMAFWNPENYYIPGQNAETNLYGGKGVQLMLVFNH